MLPAAQVAVSAVFQTKSFALFNTLFALKHFFVDYFSVLATRVSSYFQQKQHNYFGQRGLTCLCF